jgi:hypothetical protein
MTTRAQGLRRLVEAETGSGPRQAYYVNQASLLGEYFEQLPDTPWLTEADYELFPTTSVDVLVFNTVDEPVWAIIWDHEHTGTYDTDRMHLARVCAALNLPLLRANDALATLPHDGEILLRWLVRRWLAYEHQAPGLYAQQQADLEAIPADEVEAAGIWLMTDHPELDVEMIFDLENPLPSLTRITERLALKHRVALWMSHGASPEVRESFQKNPPLWRQGPTQPAWADSLDVWHIIGRCELTLVPADMSTELSREIRPGAVDSPHDDQVLGASGAYSILASNPLTKPGEGSPVNWQELLERTLEAIGSDDGAGSVAIPLSMPPAGAGIHYLASAMAEYNALLDLERQLEARSG